MQCIPGGVIQVSPHQFPLNSEQGCRSISDDDLCAGALTFFIVPVNSASAA